MDELRARLAALQRYTAKAPRAALTPVPNAGGGSDPVYEAELELAELRLTVREESLRAESLAIELHQTQSAMAQACTEAERAHQLLRDADARADRYRSEADGLRASIEELRQRERHAEVRSAALEHQIADISAARAALEEELRQARQPRNEAGAAATKPAAGAKSALPPTPPPKTVATFRGRLIES